MRPECAAALAAILCMGADTRAADPAALAPAQARGKEVYSQWCIHCHAPGVWGTNRLARRFDKDHAVLENRTDLTAAGIRAVIRAGVGSMPALRRTEVSDADADAIAAYLTRQRSQR